MRKLVLFLFIIFLISSSYSQVNVTIPDTTVNLNIDDEFYIPVYVSSLDGQDVRAFQFEVNYNPDYLSYVSMQKGNVISGGFYTDANETSSGKITIAGAGAYPLSGEGVLVKVKFKILVRGTSSVTLSNFKFNEGSPAAVITNGTVTRITDYLTVPDRFSLINYPNPFNNRTIIELNIPIKGFYELKIYDVCGRIVKQLENKTFIPGIYRINLDGDKMASGTYFCILRGKNLTKIHKITLVK